MPNAILIVGLGNPGQQYAKTRHNAGFWFVEQLAYKYNIPLKTESKYHAICGRGKVAGEDVRLLLPQTFMNKSGQSVAPFAKFFQIPTENVLVAHDELDFPTGKIQLKTGGGHGGHNGLRDIVPHIGKDFHRLRIGIDHPGHRDRVAGHVLSKASSDDQANIDAAINAAVDLSDVLIEGIVTGQLQNVMNRLNGFKPN